MNPERVRTSAQMALNDAMTRRPGAGGDIYTGGPNGCGDGQKQGVSHPLPRRGNGCGSIYGPGADAERVRVRVRIGYEYRKNEHKDNKKARPFSGAGALFGCGCGCQSSSRSASSRIASRVTGKFSL